MSPVWFSQNQLNLGTELSEFFSWKNACNLSQKVLFLFHKDWGESNFVWPSGNQSNFTLRTTKRMKNKSFCNKVFCIHLLSRFSWHCKGRLVLPENYVLQTKTDLAWAIYTFCVGGNVFRKCKKEAFEAPGSFSSWKFLRDLWMNLR